MKKDHMLFPIVFVIYIIAGIVSIVLFYNKGSELSRRLDAEAVVSETDTQPPEATEDITPDSGKTADEVSDISNPADEISEPEVPDEPETTVSEPAITEEPVDEITPEPDESEELIEETPTDDDEAEDEAADTETEDDDDADDGKTYYAFAVNKGVTNVRVRKTSDRSSEILGRVSGGDKGYVLEAGDTRSKIVTADGSLTGYVFNEYITISEIPKKEYPKEYR